MQSFGTLVISLAILGDPRHLVTNLSTLDRPEISLALKQKKTSMFTILSMH
jgi:hypothetical protein